MREFIYQIQIDDPVGSEIFDPVSRIKTWKQVSEVIPGFTFELNDVSVQLIMDWGRTAEYMEIANQRTYADYLSGKMAQWPSYFFATPPNDLNTDPPLNFSCIVQTSTDTVNDEFTAYYVQFFLYQMFLALNLSSPGCFDLSSTRIRKSLSKEEHFPRLSSFYLGAAYDFSCKQGWPIISHIPLSETWKWLQQLSPQPHLIARTRTEKALFALLHACHNAGNLPIPTDLIWLAHAMEALFDTPETGIGKALRDRIFLVLGQPATHPKKIKKSITSFYDFRSMFVHGELDIAHPLNSPEAEPLVDMLIEQSRFAISLVLASLQLLILNNWKGFEFSESFAGQSF